MTDKWTHAEAEALGKLPHDERVKMRLGERLECIWCGDDTSELRWTGFDTRMNDANPCCEECYDPPVIGDGDPISGKGYMDGPCFDDLPIAQRGALEVARKLRTEQDVSSAMQALRSVVEGGE